VADLTREDLQRLARLGAKSRLDEIRREEAAIRSAFPDLFGRRGRRSARAASSESGNPDGVAAGGRRRRRRPMSAAARKEVSERMKRYWASRRKAAEK